MTDLGKIIFPGLGGLELNPPRGFNIPGTSFTIYFYGVSIVVGLMLAAIYGLKRAKRFGIKQDDIIAEELKNCSGNFRYTRYDKYGHGMAGKFISKENWSEWMFNQSLDKR